MWWKLLLKAVLAVSSSPAAQAWAKKKARDVIDSTRAKAEKQMAGLQETAGLPPTAAKLTRLVRMKKDLVRPGQVVVVDGEAIRIVRLISSSAGETVYEGVSA